MMTTILSKYSEETWEWWWSRLSVGQGLLDLEPKPMVMIRPCCGFVGLKGFKDSSVRVNIYHLVFKHGF